MFRQLRSRDNKTRLPENTRIYAVGDIHGRADLLEQITRRIDEHLRSNPIDRSIEIYLGDYIDRGPSSRQVIDQLIHRSHSHQPVFLKGNHEAFLTKCLKNPQMLDVWGKNGGVQTLASYGIASRQGATNEALAAALKAAMPKSHHAFFKRLKSSFVCGGYFFVHAGVRPGIALNRQSESDLLWIREEFLACVEDFGKIIVHGHTPVQRPDVCSNRVNIDTGAFASGRLTCAVLEKNEIAFL